MSILRHTLLLVPVIFSLFSCGAPPDEEAPEFSLGPAGDTVSLFAPEFVSTPRNERDLAISPDGREIFYTLSTSDNLVRAIIQLVQEDGRWLPARVAPFSGLYGDIEPFFAPDGKRLYFSSTRPNGEDDKSEDYDIWFVEKTPEGWGTPQNLGAPVNTAEDEFYPSVAGNGNIYFTAAYENSKGTEDIYLSVFQDGHYLDPVSLDTTINSRNYEFNAYVTPGEDLIVFSSYGRGDDLGGGDLYYSIRNESGQWEAARHMEHGVNSTKLDYCPFVDRERENFYFTSSRRSVGNSGLALSMEDLIRKCDGIDNGMGNIYQIGLATVLGPSEK